MNTAKFLVIAALLAAAMASCGLATSDAERLEMASTSMRDGDYRAASIQLRSVLGRDPDNRQARLLLAQVLVGLNDVLTAEKELQRAAELGASARQLRPIHFKLLANKAQYSEILASLGMDDEGLTRQQVFRFRGEALIGLRNGEVAEENYREWQKIATDTDEVLVGLAKARALQGDVNAATSALNDVVSRDSGNSEAWLALAIIHYRHSEYAAARDAYRRSIDTSDPQRDVLRYVFSLIGLADSELMLEDADAARSTIRTLAAYAPGAPETLLQQARLAQLEGDYFAASRALQDLVQVTPDNVRVMMLLGSLQWRVGNVQQAESWLTRVVELLPNNLLARKMLAQVKLRQQETELAMEVLEPLLATYSTDAELYGLLAIADMQRGESKSALDKLRTASSRDPGDAASRLRLAEGYVRTGDAKTAIDILNALEPSIGGRYQRERILMAAYRDSGDIDRAFAVADELVKQNREDNRAINLAARFYLSEGRHDSGRSLVKQAMQNDPKNLRTRIMLAKLELRDANNDAAKALFAGIYGADSGNLTAILGLAQLAIRKGDVAVAISYLQRARDSQPGVALPGLILANVYMHNGRTNDAILAAQQVALIGSTDQNVIRSTGGVFFDAGAFGEAQQQFESAVQRYPQSISALLDLSRSLMSQGEFEQAHEVIQRAIHLQPDSVAANALSVLVSLRTGNIETAKRRSGELSIANPGNATVALVQGESHFAAQDYDRAIASFQSAVDLGAGVSAVIREVQAAVERGGEADPAAPLIAWIAAHPSDIRARKAIAEHYQTTGAHDDARAEYEALLLQFPEDATVLNNLALEYQYAGDLDKALRHAVAARQLRPDSGAIADTLGWIYHALGDDENGVKHLRHAMQMIPESHEVAYHLAATLARAGVAAEAKQILTDIIQTNRNFASRKQAQDLLASL